LNSNILLVFVLLVAAFLLPYLVFLMKSLRRVTPYLYLNARIRAKEGKALTGEVIEEMVAAGSVEEVASVLERSDYGDSAGSLALGGAESIERQLLFHLVELHEELSRIIPRQVQDLFTFLMMEWDVRNLKKTLRRIHADKGEAFAGEQYPALGLLDPERVKRIQECSAVDEMAPILEDTPYQGLIGLLPAYEDTANIAPLEAYCDKVVLETLWKAISLTSDFAMIREYHRLRIDMQNLKVLMRAKRDGIGLVEIRPYLIEEGDVLEIAERFFDEEDMAGFLGSFEGMEFHPPLMEAFFRLEGRDSILPLERVLDEFPLKKGKDISQKQPFGLGPLMGYLALKEAETRSVRAIARAKEVGLAPETIRGLVISL
jgi:V/A-type H+-transporting ATPase subunit C